MTKSARNYVALTIVVLCAIAAGMAVRFRGSLVQLGTHRVVRRATPVRRAISGSAIENLAPLATVTVSSARPERGGEGVADGVVDRRDWMAEEPGTAWIRLQWERPVLVTEVDLYDLPSMVDNILRGALIFDDGMDLPVESLPPNGARWSVPIPPKVVRSLTFRIDSSEGGNPGLAEIMVMGRVNE